MSPFIAEFIGSAILISFGSGVCAGLNLKGSFSKGSNWLLLCIAWGLAVTLGIFATGDISGAHLNPAVTLALAITGDFPWKEVPYYILAQILGCFTGAILVITHYWPHWSVTESAGDIKGVFCTGPAIKATIPNLWSEILGTFFLIFGLLFIGANEFTQGLKPFAVGGLIIAIGMSFGGTTGFAINPARDFGPRLAHFVFPIPGKGSSDWQYAWIPIAGPLVGAILAALFYMNIF
jgi:glycerol uptake facilitator protein